MLYIIYGTDIKKRGMARKKILKKIDHDVFSLVEVNKENVEIIKNYLQAQSLFAEIFAEKILINIHDVLSLESSRQIIYQNLENLINSENIFILDEPFALKASCDKVSRAVGIENSFDCSQIKKAKDIEPFKLCDLIEARDKKQAWLEWKKIYQEWQNKEEQALHGALWWKWKMIWQNHLMGRKVNYSPEELRKFGKEISLMAMRSSHGEIDLMREIERLILKI